MMNRTTGTSTITVVTPILAGFLAVLYFWWPRQRQEVSAKKKRQSRKAMPAGLVNIGNSCYLSSVLQLLASAGDQLILYFNDCDHQVTSSLAQVLKEINDCDKRMVRPIEFIESFAGSRVGFSLEQQDAHEFLLVLLNLRNRKLKKSIGSIAIDPIEIKDISLLSSNNPFTCIIVNELICLPCASKRKVRHISSMSFESTVCVTLISDDLSVSDAVYNQLCGTEKYSDYCNYSRDGGKCGYGAMKVRHPIQLPQYLFLHVSLLTGPLKSQNSLRTEAHLISPDYRYILTGLIVHYGASGAGGHYVCFRRGAKGKGGWFECNDETVKLVTEEFVLSQKAYILLYEKQNENKRQETINDKR